MGRRLACGWLCLLLALVTSSCAVAAAPPTLGPEPTLSATPQPTDCYGSIPTGAPTALVDGVLIDGTGADPLADAALVIEGCRITAVGSTGEVAIPEGARVIDVDGDTILPGFVDAHVHNAYDGRNLRTWAEEGVTTVRDLGAPFGYPYCEERDRLATDPANARVVSAGPLVTVPDGYPIVPNGVESLAVISPEDARSQVGRLIDGGVDVIKLAFSGSPPTLSPGEAAAIVQTAHQRRIPVTAHATNPRELQRALDAGVDDVAHISGDKVGDRTIRRMVDAGVYWVPTLKALHGEGRDNLSRFVGEGGHVAVGTDAGYLAGLQVGMPLEELALMEEAGMTHMQIIVAATRNGAHVCRLERHLGTLEVGKLADVLVVEGDPLQDLGALADVSLVIHGGVTIRQ